MSKIRFHILANDYGRSRLLFEHHSGIIDVQYTLTDTEIWVWASATTTDFDQLQSPLTICFESI